MNYDMLILAAPVAVIGLWCLTLLLAMLRKWRAAGVTLLVSVAMNVWLEQVPVNAWHSVTKVVRNGSLQQLGPKEEGTFRVLAYNVCGKPEYVPRHGDQFLQYLKELDADILFLPENNPGAVVRMDSMLQVMYPYSMRQFEDGKHWLGEHTLYSKFPLSNGRFYKINLNRLIEDHPELDSLYVRRAGDTPFIYQADADINGTTVTLLHVHLRSNRYDSAKAEGVRKREKAYNVLDHLNFGYTYREVEARMIVDSLRHNPNPLLICGDFNDLSGSVAMEMIQNCREYNVHAQHRDRLKNAWWEKGCGLGFTFADQHLRLRLDHILYSKELELKDVTILKVNYSDHRPVVGEFVIKGEERGSRGIDEPRDR